MINYNNNGKLKGGISNPLKAPSKPSLSPTVTSRPSPTTSIKPIPQEEVVQDQVIQRQEIKIQKTALPPGEVDDGTFLFWVLVGLFAIGMLRG